MQAHAWRRFRMVTTRGIAAAAAALFLSASPVGAVTLTTPYLLPNGSQILRCFVTNTGAKPITVGVELVGPDGQSVTSSGYNCPVPPATLAPRATCTVVVPSGQSVYCVVSSKSKSVRGSLALYNSDGVEFVSQAPATK